MHYCLKLITAFAAVSLIAACVNGTGRHVGDDKATLVFRVGGVSSVTYKLADMKERLLEREITLFDIYYETEKSYRAFSICGVLRLGFGEDAAVDSGNVVLFVASDQYTASTDLKKICREESGFLAFADTESQNWEMLPSYDVNPGPFYVVWSEPGQTPEAGYPWPWQLAEIHLVAE